MKKIKSIFITLLALVIAFSLVGCGDDSTKGGNFDQVQQGISQMPTTSDATVAEGAVKGIFGIDLNLPDGAVSAQSITTGGVSGYVIEITCDTSAEDYYDSIRSQMQSKGYTVEADDGAYYFYKMSGNVIYSVTIEEEYDGLTITTGAMQNPNSPPSGGGGGGTGGTGVSGDYTSLTNSSSKTQIEGTLRTVFGINVTLPTGERHSATKMSLSDLMIVYSIKIDNDDLNIRDYMVSIASSMASAGYTQVYGSEYLKTTSTEVIRVTSADYGSQKEISFTITMTEGDEGSGGSTDEGELTSWPSAQINQIFSTFGVEIPSYDADTYSVKGVQNDADETKMITIYCYGADSTDETNFKTELANAGFVYSGGYYKYFHATENYYHVEVRFGVAGGIKTVTIEAERMPYTLNANMKVIYTEEVPGVENTIEIIKIGSTYYRKEIAPYGTPDEELYMLSDGGWLYYYLEDGEWVLGDGGYLYGAEGVHYAVFDFMVDDIPYSAEKGEDVTFLEQACEQYTGEFSELYLSKQSGLVLYLYESLSTTYIRQVTSIDTTVTSFGFDLPTIQ